MQIHSPTAARTDDGVAIAYHTRGTGPSDVTVLAIASMTSETGGVKQSPKARAAARAVAGAALRCSGRVALGKSVITAYAFAGKRRRTDQ